MIMPCSVSPALAILRCITRHKYGSAHWIADGGPQVYFVAHVVIERPDEVEGVMRHRFPNWDPYHIDFNNRGRSFASQPTLQQCQVHQLQQPLEINGGLPVKRTA